MPDRRERGQIIDKRIVTAKSISQQTSEPTFTIAVRIPVQIIPPHLIHHDPNDQPRPPDYGTTFELTACDKKNKEENRAEKRLPGHRIKICRKSIELTASPNALFLHRCQL
jgi:hypothetical protein